MHGGLVCPDTRADGHVVGDQPEYGRGANDADEAEPDMRRGNPAGQHEDGQQRQADAGGRARTRHTPRASTSTGRLPTDHALDEFAQHAAPGDVLVDGGNSNFRDSMRRAEKYSALGIRIGVNYIVYAMTH